MDDMVSGHGSRGQRIAAAARSLLGVPFRLHGRDPAAGVDCVGLALFSVRAAGVQVAEPPPYRIRGDRHIPAMRWLETLGLETLGLRLADDAAVGDIVVAQVSPIQMHLLVDGGVAMINAHAGLGRVVEMPWPTEWRLMSRFRVGEN